MDMSDASEKIPIDTTGDRSRDLRLVAQRLNHYATPGPIYLGTFINSKNVICEEIWPVIAICDRCLIILGLIFRSRAVSKQNYNITVQPVVQYGRETWPMTEMHMKRLNTLREENVKEDVWTGG
jgi:hypothetical protein